MTLMNASTGIYTGEDIESSVTMFVNEGFIDVTESKLEIEQDDTHTLEAKVSKYINQLFLLSRGAHMHYNIGCTIL